MSNIEKFKAEEKTRITFLKHRGNVLATAEDLGYPLEYVKKVTAKFRKQTKHDGDILAVTSNISSHILFNAEHRMLHLQNCLDQLENKITSIVSHCCNGGLEEAPADDGTMYYICIVCKENTQPKVRTNLAVVTAIQETVKELRAEDSAIVDFAVKMGYTNAEVPVINRITQHNITIAAKVPEGLDLSVTQKASEMSPTDRQQVRKKIENTILNQPELETKSDESK